MVEMDIKTVIVNNLDTVGFTINLQIVMIVPLEIYLIKDVS